MLTRRQVLEAAFAGTTLLLFPRLGRTQQVPSDDDAPTRVLVMGDQGFQNADQYRVASAMRTVFEDRGADFVIALGDNIYQFGAQSAHDPQFETAFEIPYQGIDLPFYMVLGNHDNGTTGNHYDIGNNQVAYHYRTDRTTGRWYMPSRYYSVVHGNVELIVVDTNFLPSPDVPTPILGIPEGYRESQERWVQEQLSAPRRAPWRISASHHPVITNYGADSSESLLRFLDPLVAGVDLHLSGHDHTLQWNHADAERGPAEYIVVGASSFPTFPDHTFDVPLASWPSRFGNGHRLGFAVLELHATSMTGAFYGLTLTGEPDLLFQHTIRHPRVGVWSTSRGEERSAGERWTS